MNKNHGIHISRICSFILIFSSLFFHSISHAKDIKAFDIDSNTIGLWHMNSLNNNAGFNQVIDETGKFNLQQTHKNKALKLINSAGGAGKSITGFNNYTGSLDLIDAINVGLPDPTSQTFEAWIKWDDTRSLPQNRASKKQTVMSRLVGSTSSVWLYFINNQIKLSIRSGDRRNEEKVYTAIINPKSELWYHVAFTIDVNDFDQQGDKIDTKVKLYFNDVNSTDPTPEPLVNIKTATKGVVYEDFKYRANGWLFRIGKRYRISNAQFRGLIDEVRLSNIAKTTFDVFESIARNESTPVEVPFIPVSNEKTTITENPTPIVSEPTTHIPPSTSINETPATNNADDTQDSSNNSTASCDKSLKLDGINDWVNIPNLTLAKDFTVEGWFKLAPGIDYKDALFGQEGHGPDIHFSAGRVRLYAYGIRVTANTPLLADTWGHIAITRKGSNLAVYVNGVKDATGKWNGSLRLQAIGRGNRGFVKGMIDEIRIWDIARTGAEIIKNFDTTIAPDTLGLIGYWNFNDAGQTIIDVSSSENHASLGASTSIKSDDPVQLNSTIPHAKNCDDDSEREDSSEKLITNNDTDSTQDDKVILKYKIGGSISGLASGNSLILKNNDSNNLTVNKNGSFNFTNLLIDGSNYSVSIDLQSPLQNQTCSLGSEKGKLTGSNITDIKVVCVDIVIAPAPAPAPGDYKVTFEPPVMNNPEIIDLSEVKPIKWPAYGLICSGLIINVSLNKDEDYIVMMSGNTPLKYPVRVEGGRNVRMVGLDIRPIVQSGCEIGQLPVNLRPSGQRKNANYHPRMPLGMAMQLIQTHTSFVEGVFIDLNGIEADCFVARNYGGLPNSVARKQRDIVIQNTACWGGESQQYTAKYGDGLHGDFFQNQGEVMRNFVIENSTQHSSGHSLVQHSWEGYRAAVKNVIKRYDYSEDQRYAYDDVGDKGGMGYIMDGNADDWIIEDVYGEGQSVIQTMIVSRPPDGPLEQFSYTNINASIRENSNIHLGKPKNGHFAKKANIGLNYVSPHQ